MRYALTNEKPVAERLSYDVLIVGAGIAGLYTALHIDEKYSCCIITKESVEICSSWLAQGGIAAAMATDDNPNLHLSDTLIAGAGLCNEEAARVLVEEGPSDIRMLQSMKVPFDLSDEGSLQIGREGGHRKNRVVHAGGDATGRETMKVLARLAAARQNISFLGHSLLLDLMLNENGEISGAYLVGPDDKLYAVDSQCVVIATGGIGQVYRTSTNPSVATGDGIAAAMRAGALIEGIEFVQFHPTGLFSGSGEDRAFLISEAVRGEGGFLKNSDGVRFMLGQHELAELAPRDIVARGIVRELEKSGESHVFIDITSKDADFLSHRFPTIYGECMSRGIDISKDFIPVHPVQHYLIGGIATDLYARTNIIGLYACGEAASTGVHGANRLASNSMLECLVFGRRAAISINSNMEASKKREKAAGEQPVLPDSRPGCEQDLHSLWNEIRRLMSENCGVIRKKEGMEASLSRLEEICQFLESRFVFSREYFDTLNIATIARAINRAALKRLGSIGAHYREN